MANGDQSNQNQQPQPGAPTPPPSGGMKIDVTPQQPVQRYSPPEELLTGEKERRLPVKLIGAAIAAIVVIALVALFVLPSIHKTTTTTIQSTTTISSQAGYLSSCGVISTPGSYYLQGDIKYAAAVGSCINVTASNVNLICNGYGIDGSGPYVGIPPYSYGIVINGNSNVSITGCGISNFSFAVYSTGVRGLSLLDSNLTRNYVSSVYMSATHNSTIENNYIAFSNSQQGAINITDGSSNNQFLNNTLRFNVFVSFLVNSPGNTYRNNRITDTQLAFECSSGSGFSNQSTASGNICGNQTGCGFLRCSIGNIPLNFSKISLSPSVRSCGLINVPGKYNLETNLNASALSDTNVSELQAYNMPCINVNASNVNLQCNNHTITSSYIGILVSARNVSLSNCDVSGSIIGVGVDNVNKATINTATLLNNYVSLSMAGTTGDIISGTNTSGSTYGMYLSQAQANIFSNFTANNNEFGIYLTGSLGNIFNRGTAINNSKFDVYATADSQNSSTNIMSSTSCNVSDAAWTTCTAITSNSLELLYPINSCYDIKRAGMYVLTQNVITSFQMCIKVLSNNVVLNCSGYGVSTSSGGSISGPAIYINDRKNVTINNCRIGGYNSAVGVYNSSSITINGIIGTSIPQTGITLINDTLTNVSRVFMRGTSNFSIMLQNTRDSNIFNNNMSSGINQNTGILVWNSTFNRITGNLGTNNYIGMYFKGRSTNNTVYNNSFTSSQADYQCDPQDNPLNAGNGGINYGTKETGCYWLATIPATVGPLPCTAVMGTQIFSLTNDYAYTTGTTCFTVYSNNTQINCNGHTILAINGGTFVKFLNGSGSELENCYFKGFNQVAYVTGEASPVIYNNTIFYNTTPLFPNSSTVINVTKNVGSGVGTIIQSNKIFTPYKGILLNNVSGGALLSNNVTALDTAYALYNVTYLQIRNNTAGPGSGIGMVLYNSTQNNFLDNDFSGVTGGLYCIKSADDTDSSGNSCSSTNGACSWVIASKPTCK